MIIEALKAAENKPKLDSTLSMNERAFRVEVVEVYIFIKFKVKRRSIVSAFFTKKSIIYKN